MSDIDEVRAAARDAIRAFFDNNRFLRAIEERCLMREDYQQLLYNLFHQVDLGTYSFAQAAVSCQDRWPELKRYFLQHAGEELDHREWARSDLRALAPQAPDPASLFPSPAATNFIAFNAYVAQQFPPARLAGSAVLEGLAFRSNSGARLEQLAHLGLKPEQCSFILRHADADPKHEREVWEMIETLQLSPAEWGWMAYATRTAGRLYKAMYDDCIAPGRLSAQR